MHELKNSIQNFKSRLDDARESIGDRRQDI